MQRQTTTAHKQDIKRSWFIVDATSQPLGRLASQIAMVLMGKTKPTYTPNVDCGDFVIVINAEKVGLSGDKVNTKKYYNNSQFLAGLRTRTAGEMVKNFPEEMIERSVWGMLPKGRLGRQMVKKLKVYKGPKHDQEAQQPQVLTFKF